MKNQFYQRLKYLPQEIWSKTALIDELKGRWVSGAKLNPQALGRLKRSVLIASTGASTRMEGSQLSDEDIERLMRGLAVQKFVNRDQQEAKGYYELLSNVFDSWQTLSFTESTIKHFHKELLKYVDKDKIHRGAYKKSENKVRMIDAAGQSVGILFDTTPAYLTPKEMLELVEAARKAFEDKKYHPLIITGNFLAEFLLIHPFQDGNGRLSRILTNLLLLKCGYVYTPYISHEKFIENNKADYYIALRKSLKTMRGSKPDLSPWIEFFLSIVYKQSEIAIHLLSKESVEKLFSPKQLVIWEFLQGVDVATSGEISKKTKVAQPTVKQVLNKLLALKKIERVGQGRTTRYRKI